ncbi:hypothetical protein AAVH_11432 [Aphelenchoides avenae]|nr:hypothetical protein AAVH_11432 [Aphelenchus avenae]
MDPWTNAPRKRPLRRSLSSTQLADRELSWWPVRSSALSKCVTGAGLQSRLLEYDLANPYQSRVRDASFYPYVCRSYYENKLNRTFGYKRYTYWTEPVAEQQPSSRDRICYCAAQPRHTVRTCIRSYNQDNFARWHQDYDAPYNPYHSRYTHPYPPHGLYFSVKA